MISFFILLFLYLYTININLVYLFLYVIVGASIGDMVLPMIVGWFMMAFGSSAMLYCVFFILCIAFGTFVLLMWQGQKRQKQLLNNKNQLDLVLEEEEEEELGLDNSSVFTIEDEEDNTTPQ